MAIAGPIIGGVIALSAGSGGVFGLTGNIAPIGLSMAAIKKKNLREKQVLGMLQLFLGILLIVQNRKKKRKNLF